ESAFSSEAPTESRLAEVDVAIRQALQSPSNAGRREASQGDSGFLDAGIQTPHARRSPHVRMERDRTVVRLADGARHGRLREERPAADRAFRFVCPANRRS